MVDLKSILLRSSEVMKRTHVGIEAWQAATDFQREAWRDEARMQVLKEAEDSETNPSNDRRMESVETRLALMETRLTQYDVSVTDFVSKVADLHTQIAALTQQIQDAVAVKPPTGG